MSSLEAGDVLSYISGYNSRPPCGTDTLSSQTERSESIKYLGEKADITEEEQFHGGVIPNVRYNVLKMTERFSNAMGILLVWIRYHISNHRNESQIDHHMIQNYNND